MPTNAYVQEHHTVIHMRIVLHASTHMLDCTPKHLHHIHSQRAAEVVNDRTEEEAVDVL